MKKHDKAAQKYENNVKKLAHTALQGRESAFVISAGDYQAFRYLQMRMCFLSSRQAADL